VREDRAKDMQLVEIIRIESITGSPPGAAVNIRPGRRSTVPDNDNVPAAVAQSAADGHHAHPD
jgi:hypothetical protein